jgi:hypothetical protein
MPEPVTAGALVAAALAAGASEAGKAALGGVAKDAYEALKTAAARLLGPALAMLEKKPDSDDLAAGVAETVDAAPAPDREALRTLAETLRETLAAEGRGASIDNRVTVIATHGSMAAGRDLNVTLPGNS